MSKRYKLKTKIIKVTHPIYKEVTLFEAKVDIFNFNADLVRQIEKIEIKYTLRKPQGEPLKA